MTTVATPARPAEPAKRPPVARPAVTTRRVLNVPLLIITGVVIAVLAPAGYFWHELMLNRSAVMYLNKATEEEEDENWNEASRYLFQYLQVHNDDEVRVRLAEDFDKATKDDYRRKGRAKELYLKAVGLAPDRVDLRRRLAELLLELRLFDNAQSEVNTLLEKFPGDPIGLKVQALSGYALYRSNMKGAPSADGLVRQFEKAVAANPTDSTLAQTFAYIYRSDLSQPSESERIQLADEVIDRLVERAPNDPEIRLARFSYNQRYNRSGVQEDIRRAVELGGNKVSVNLAAGENALNVGRDAYRDKRWDESRQAFEDATRFYKKVIELEPDNAQGHMGLGQTYLAQNKAGLAIEAWQQGLKQVTKDLELSTGAVDLNAALVHALVALGRHDEVEELLSKLDKQISRLATSVDKKRLAPAANTVKFLRAKWESGKGNHREAIELLTQVVLAHEGIDKNKRIFDEAVEAYRLLGSSYRDVGQYDQAALAYERAANLRPANKQFWMDAANMHRLAGNNRRAQVCLERALKLEGARTTTLTPCFTSWTRRSNKKRASLKKSASGRRFRK